MSASTLQRRYTEAEIEAMATPDLLSLYKQTGDEELKWPLVLRYEGLIKSAALQIRGVYSSFAQVDDIVSEGILTLLTSIDKFDPDKGIKFETYVAKRIRGMVIDLARKQDWLPRNIRQRAKEIDSAVSHLANEQPPFKNPKCSDTQERKPLCIYSSAKITSTVFSPAYTMPGPAGTAMQISPLPPARRIITPYSANILPWKQTMKKVKK